MPGMGAGPISPREVFTILNDQKGKAVRAGDNHRVEEVDNFILLLPNKMQAFYHLMKPVRK